MKMQISRIYLFIYLFIYLTLFKVGIHQLDWTLIKTNYNNENKYKNLTNFLVSLLITNGPLTIPYSQYVEVSSKGLRHRKTSS